MQFNTERVEREDLVTFINACFACSGQFEYYGDGRGTDVSIGFLHDYILGNYRRLYARTLAAGINHFNQSLVIANLLSSGANSAPDKPEEGALIAAALRAMPVSRALRTLGLLRERGVNNRRARAVTRDWLNNRRDLSHIALKYRPRLRAVARHEHCALDAETQTFLRSGGRPKTPYATPLFEAFRLARTHPEAMYALPFTVAEGFATKHRVPREEFLRRIEPSMTSLERLRLQSSAREAPEVDLTRVPLTRLCSYALSLSLEERAARREEFTEALTVAADRALARAPLRLGRVAVVLDRSHSAAGTDARRNRALAVALGANALLRAASRAFRAFFTAQSGASDDPLMMTAAGQTDLATPLIDALAWRPELVVIVSDGFENAPAGGVSEVIRVFRERIDPRRETSFVHVNPVFDAERFAPRALGPALPTVGLRDAEDLATMLGFARCADGTGTLPELLGYLDARVHEMLERR